MRRTYTTQGLFFLFLSFLFLSSLQAATVTITTDTDWSAATINSADDVVVKNGAILTVDIFNAECASLRLGDNGTNAGTGTLSFSTSTSRLTVNGTVFFGKSGGGAPEAGFLNLANGGRLTVNEFAVANNSTFGGCSCTAGTIELQATNILPSSSFTEFYNLTIKAGTTTLGNQDITVTNRLRLESGATLDFGTKNLTVEGDIDNNGGTITTGGKTLTLSGGLDQEISDITVGNLTISKTVGDVVLGGDVTIDNSLTFSSDTKILLGAYNITIGTNASISGYSPARYIVTTGTGALRQEDIGSGGRTGSVVFPVGVSSSSYTPVTINNSGGTADRFDVRVCDGVYYDGNCSGGTPYTENAIDKTWNISEAISGGSLAAITFQWNSSDELAGFDRNSVYISHHNGTRWETLGISGSASGTDPYTRTVSGVSNFSPFGVGGGGGALPIELTSFYAQYTEGVVLLEWETASEYNNDYFSIEKSVNGTGFSEIGTVDGAGHSDEPLEYTFQDNETFVGTVYYRLKQVDYDGTFAYSEIVAVNVDEKMLSVTVYPNPSFQRQLNINIKGDDDASVKVYNVQMQEIFSLENITAGKHQLNLPEHLSAGVYFIHVNNSALQVTEKIVLK